MNRDRRAVPQMAVDLTAGQVVLTMSPRRAHALAKSLAVGVIDHTEWRDDIVTKLTAAAVSGEASSRAMPTITRGEFLGGHWKLGPDRRAQATAEPRTSDAVRAMKRSDPTVERPLDSVPLVVSATTNPGTAPSVPRRSINAASGDAAAAVVAEAVAIATQAQTAVAAELEVAAAQAVVTARDAVAAAAERTAEAAETARGAKAVAVDMAAQAAAKKASETAAAVQREADGSALTVAEAATAAMAVLVSDDDAGSVVAARLAAIVSAAAVATAETTAVAAAMVAHAVAVAAREAAAAAAAAAAMVEHEVSLAAVDVQAVADATARHLASETAARATGVAMANREANEARAMSGKAVDRSGGEPRVAASSAVLARVGVAAESLGN
jgi:hypothetical protein